MYFERVVVLGVQFLNYQNYFIKKFMSNIYYGYSIFSKIHPGGFAVNTNSLKYEEASSFTSSVFIIILTIYFKKKKR